MKKNIIRLFINLLIGISIMSCANEYGRLIAENQKKADDFLLQNKDKVGVITLPSGVQYKVLRKGEGESPTLSNEVMIHYKGSKLDGSVFDSSYAKVGPQKFRIEETIEGWQKVIVLMRPNSIWRVFIPPDLAYGRKGSQNLIGPNELLIFDIELVEIL
jgi:FKBP-type peptidyl-prolyl cis-trans isomerase FklB